MPASYPLTLSGKLHSVCKLSLVSIICMKGYSQVANMWLQAQQFLQQGVQRLEAQPDHQEAVPSQEELVEMQNSIRNLLQLKEAGNK